MAKLPNVKCPYCEEIFSREEYPDFVHIGNRYYHKKCYDKKMENEEYYNKIHEYCKNKYGTNYSKRRIDQQIKELIEDGRSMTGIYRTLVYWYDVSDGDVSKSHGSIRIVGYVYDDAMRYYENKWRLEQQQAELLKGSLDLGTDVFYISPTPIEKPKRVKLFDIH